MVEKALTLFQLRLLEDAMKYNSNEDSNGAIGNSLAETLTKAFGDNIPNTSSLTEEKLRFYNTFASISSQQLYNSPEIQKFKTLFNKLKKAGYNGPQDTGMKDYKDMGWIESWSYYSEIKKDLDVFS